VKIRLIVLFFLVSYLSSLSIGATEHQTDSTETQELNEQKDEMVTYPATFFSRYNPSTALEMVRQLPGFILDDGEFIRGFGESVGNVLINDNYPSAKQDTPTAILSRIPASRVEKIEIIRSQVRGIDMRGHPVLANILLMEDSPVAVQWEWFGTHSVRAPFRTGLNVSMSHSFEAIDYSIGVDVERQGSGELGSDLVYDGNDNLVETRNEELREYGLRLVGVFLNTSTWIGDSFVQLNVKKGVTRGAERLSSVRKLVPFTPPVELRSLKFSEYRPVFEIGMDIERNLQEDLTGKAIFLFTRDNSEFITRQINLDLPETQTLFRRSDSGRLEKEAIARLEFNWEKFANHNIQLNMEGALNTLDGGLIQIVDTGAGLFPVEVPGANSRVEEKRGDFLLKDTWTLGNLELDFGVGAEVSNIAQTGDIDQERNFVFVKPQLVLTYNSGDTHQSTLLFIRDVSQLDFNDFVSASVFEDDDLALGNPDLKPEKTWVSEFINEWRWGQDSVYKLALYYHRINDVDDLLPLTPDFEVPGNIGNGHRFGVRFESTTPLDWLGLENAKLDFKLRLQDSSVTDPVTGNKRQLTARGFFSGPTNIRFNNENEYVFDVAYRQDFQDAQISWGWDIAEQANRPRFKVNELEIFNEGLEANIFVETTRWYGVKIRLDARNLFNYDESRNRTIYVGERGQSPIDSRIIRDRTVGTRLTLTLSSSF
jgi:outer membrane receptor protein involved in Fe transport